MTAAAITYDDMTAVPDYIEPVIAWRAWRISGRGERVLLESLFVDTVWLPGQPFDATCKSGRRSRWRPWRIELNDHAAPDFECTCGIYAVASPEAAAKYITDPYALGRVDRVLGRVAMWGDVVEGTSGWRASHGYPVELWVPARTADGRGLRRRAYLDEIAAGLEAYNVPVDIVGDPLSLVDAGHS